MTNTHQLTTATERAMAGGILSDAGELAHVRAEINSAEIGDDIARATFDAACTTADEGATVSPVTVAARLESMGVIGLVGGLAGLDALVALARPGERAAVIQRVKDHSRVRRAAKHAAKLAEIGQTTEALESPDRYLAAVAAVAEKSREHLQRGWVTSGDAAKSAYGAWSARGEKSDASPTCLPELDDMLGDGLQAGRETVIAARPGVGKTALMVQACYGGAAIGHPQLVFEREASVEDIFDRAVIQRTKIHKGRYEKGPTELVTREGRAVIEAHTSISRMPVTIDVNERDVGAMLARAIIWLETVARPLVEARAEHPDERLREIGLVPVVWIDYLQRCDLAGKFGSREEKVSAMSDMFASFALKQKCHVGLICMINRSNKKENRPPRIDDLRESGSIEQDAGAVVLLHRDAGAVVDDDPNAGRIVEQDAIAIVDKNRHGPTGVVRATWHGPTGRLTPRVQTYDREDATHARH